MLFVTIQLTMAQDPEHKGPFQVTLGCLSIALSMAGVPMILPRYRSLRMFSWLLLIAAFFQLWMTQTTDRETSLNRALTPNTRRIELRALSVSPIGFRGGKPS
jgi:hypothetical protein